jgi:uncharacterized membrane protein YphA (DoxX/SURF4 family)
MNTALWVAQILLALVFAGSGISKLVQPYEKLAAQMGYVNDYTPGAIRAIGTLEVLGALGVILPALTGILPWLSPLAAGGLAVNMGGATSTHLRRKEVPMMIFNLVLIVLAMFVVYGRLALVPL